MLRFLASNGRLFLLAAVLALPVPSLDSQESPPAEKARPGPDSPTVTVLTEQTSHEGAIGDLTWVSTEEAPALRLGDQTIPLGTVLRLELAAGEPSSTDLEPVLVILRSGEQVSGRLAPGDEENLRFTAGLLATPETPSVAIEKVRAVLVRQGFENSRTFTRFRARLDPGSRGPIPVRSDAWSPEKKDGESPEAPEDSLLDDRLHTSEGTTLSGLLLEVGPSGVLFETDDLGEVRLGLDRIRAVELADLPEEETATGSGPEGSEIELLVSTASGDRLRGRPAGIRDAHLQLDSLSLGRVEVPLGKLQTVEVLGGKTVFLSDLDPVETTSKDPFSPRPVQRDLNVRSGPLKIADQVYRKGLGMRSHTRLTYDLAASYERFQALLGIDDLARQTTLQSRQQGGGVAVFRVFLDDRVAFQKQISVRDSAVKLDLPVGGVRSLRLEVDYGPGLWIQDFANWADARLIRQSS